MVRGGWRVEGWKERWRWMRLGK
ncbi:hypothetical protein E2C01_100876 [Portunus trituberculatus]|uniref:Uncharacterized protein n=1 Tax=Portunus trituberculatus TaxID=210409 RepID=A0A5B7KE58_PORTR|nr:hypothetical protein [Portunus trituberculatus]